MRRLKLRFAIWALLAGTMAAVVMGVCLSRSVIPYAASTTLSIIDPAPSAREVAMPDVGALDEWERAWAILEYQNAKAVAAVELTSQQFIYQRLYATRLPRALSIVASLMGGVCGAAVVVMLFCLLSRKTTGLELQDGFTYCGKCNYILRGLREPRCPECGNVL